jgi:hypothetical protein
MKRLCLHLLLAAFALAIVACATTSFDTTWKSPEAKPLHLRGRKIAAVFISRDPLLRRLAEDAMVREIQDRGAVGVAAYTFLSDADVREPEVPRAKAQELGCAAAAVMRVVGRETVYRRHEPPPVIWVRPPYRRIWRDYWGWGWGTVWAPGYLREDRIVKIETLVYSLDDDELVWAGVTHTFEPFRIEELIAEMAEDVVEEMSDAGLIAASGTRARR